MIKYTTGNILEATTEALVNTVNCVGIMGRGIALQFKKQFPENFVAYQKACANHELKPGKMFIFAQPTLKDTRYIITSQPKDIGGDAVEWKIFKQAYRHSNK